MRQGAEGQGGQNLAPTPIPDPTCNQVQWGKEVVSRFASGLDSSAELYTDSNGREMQRRQRDYRPSWQLKQTEPVAGNYFPVNTAAFVRDAEAQLTILTDGSQGGASLASGQIELMVHRRLLKDDARGVGEPLNETEHASPYTGRDPNQGGAHSGRALIVRGTHYVSLEPAASAAAVWRPLMDRVYAKPLVAFAPAAGAPERSTSSALRVPLPPNLQVRTLAHAVHVHMDMHAHAHACLHMHRHMHMQVVTLVRTAADAYLLRLAHQFGLGEDPLLSLPATVGHHRGVAAWVCEEGLEPSLAVLHHHHHHHHLLYPRLHLLRSHHLHSHPFHSHHFFHHLPPSPPSPSPPPGRRRHTLRRRRDAGDRKHRRALTHGQPAQG